MPRKRSADEPIALTMTPVEARAAVGEVAWCRDRIPRPIGNAELGAETGDRCTTAAIRHNRAAGVPSR